MTTYHFVEQGSEQWKADRVGKYTGSNADKLLSSFGAHEFAKAIEQSFKGNFWTRRGHILEDEALDLYEQIYKTAIMRDDKGIKVGYITNSLYPSCLYSPDGVVPNILVEVKCFDIENHMKLTNGNIPLKILAQIHFGLLISGLKVAHLLAYNPEIEDPKQAFKVITIRRDPAIVANFKRILNNERVPA